MSGVGVGRATAFAVPVILLIVGGLYAVSYFVATLLGLPPSFAFSPVVSVAGWAILFVGVAVGGWVFRYRSPSVMIVSSYITFTKMFRRAPFREMSGRAEPLVVEGPQRYSRNPLYFAVLLISFGWSLASATTYVLIWAAELLVWFSVVLIPFEERELRALFGEQYARYAENVPMLLPFTKRRKARLHLSDQT